jgi:Sulfotransferase domain
MYFRIIAIFSFLACFTHNLPADEWNRVYLATYPRSGNHWVRHLIEDATLIATSSAYQDIEVHPDTERSHLPDPFPWGGYCAQNGYRGNCRYPCAGETVVIKTHYPYFPAFNSDNLPHSKVIRIVRHPIDAICSMIFYGCPPPYPKKLSSEHVRWQIQMWKSFQQYWNSQENVVTIRYEDLCQEPELHLMLILNEIGYSFTEDNIKSAFKNNPPKPILSKSHYFEEFDLIYMQTELEYLLKQFNYLVPFDED